MIVLGIDPGSHITGFGLISSSGNQLAHVDNGIIESPRHAPLSTRLQYIHEHIKGLISKYRPDTVALETLFVARNMKSAMVLSHARGVIMQCTIAEGLPILEYTPREVKQAVVGYGAATKEQIQQMTRMLLHLPEMACEDAADALAVAICHCQTYRLQDRLRGMGSDPTGHGV